MERSTTDQVLDNVFNKLIAQVGMSTLYDFISVEIMNANGPFFQLDDDDPRIICKRFIVESFDKNGNRMRSCLAEKSVLPEFSVLTKCACFKINGVLCNAWLGIKDRSLLAYFDVTTFNRYSQYVRTTVLDHIVQRSSHLSDLHRHLLDKVTLLVLPKDAHCSECSRRLSEVLPAHMRVQGGYAFCGERCLSRHELHHHHKD